MHIIDSHCHLDRVDLEQFDHDFDIMLETAKTHNIREFLCVCIDFNNAEVVRDMAVKYPNIYASFGLHPVNDIGYVPTLDEIREGAQYNEVIAVGETGLDYYYVKEDKEWQHQRFRNHIAVSNELGKPLIIHTRDAKEDTIRIMREEGAKSGIMHCFVEDLETAEQAIELGFYISFSGVVTFNSAKDLMEVAQAIPLERILVETDAPYLTPAPYRGKPNHPANTYYVAKHIAQLRGISLEEVAEATTHNFRTLFKM